MLVCATELHYFISLSLSFAGFMERFFLFVSLFCLSLYPEGDVVGVFSSYAPPPHPTPPPFCVHQSDSCPFVTHQSDASLSVIFACGRFTETGEGVNMPEGNRNTPTNPPPPSHPCRSVMDVTHGCCHCCHPVTFKHHAVSKGSTRFPSLP